MIDLNVSPFHAEVRRALFDFSLAHNQEQFFRRCLLLPAVRPAGRGSGLLVRMVQRDVGPFSGPVARLDIGSMLQC